MAEDDLLQSWKEIAAYLGRSERTCRRWETEYRLPVHRMDGAVRGSVFAYKSELDRWMDEILHEERRVPPSSKRLGTRRNLAIILVLTVISVTAIAVMLLRDGRSEPRQPSAFTNPTVAILPFTNNTGDESLDFWENALADLLTSDLSQSRYLSVLSRDRTFRVLRNLGQLDAEDDTAIDLTEVAARAGVENIVVGNFMRAGQRFRISATVRHIPTEDTVVLPSVEARNEEEIFLRIDELSRKIKNHLVRPGDRTSRDIDLDVGTITTSSIEAYRYYVDGRSSLYSVRAVEAMESLEMAVAIDPEFAMAYSLLATCYRSLPGCEDKAEEALSRAFELSHNASLRERFFIRAYYYRNRGSRGWGKYLETCQEFVKVYPDDARAVLFLGEVYFRLEEWDRSIETLEPIIDVRDLRKQFVYMQRANGAIGKYEEALAVAGAAPAERYPHQYPYQMALNMIYARNFELALLEADKILDRAPGYATGLMVKGDVHFYRAEWDQAEVYYRELLTSIGTEYRRLRFRLAGWLRLANLYLAKGQFERALDTLDQAIDEVTAGGENTSLSAFHDAKAYILLAQGDLSGANAETQVSLEQLKRGDHVTGVISALHTHGMILLEKGDVAGAERVADEMKAEIDGWLNPKLKRFWCLHAGHIDLARNDLGRAVKRFEEAIALLPYQHEPDGDNHAAYYGSLAYAHYLSGEIGKAQEWYEKILELTSGRLGFGDVYARSHFMLGRIHERRGRNAEAIRMYRTYLDLLREADSPTPEIEQAKKSLAALLG